MVCKDTSKTYLKGLNAIISLGGLAVVGAGIYGLVKFKTEFDAVNQWAVYAPIALGVVVFLVGMLGCWGASAQNKVALVFYWIVMTLCTILVLAVGVTFMIQIGYLDDVQLGNSADLVNEGRKNINDFILGGVYNQCCNPSSAEMALPCSTLNPSSACINNPNVNYTIPTDVCNALDTAGALDKCSAGAAAFLGAFSSFMADNIQPIGITLIVLSVLLLLADIFTCCLICTNREDYDKEYRKRIQQQQAGNLAGTSPQGIQYH